MAQIESPTARTRPDQRETRGITPLPGDLDARRLLSHGQAASLGVLAAAAAAIAAARAAGFGPSPLWWAGATVAVVTVIYVLVIVFKLLLVLGAGGAPATRFEEADGWFEEADGRAVPDQALPVYTVLVPLGRRGAALGTLITEFSGLDYPPERLQVLLLVEEDDQQTRTALDSVALPAPFEVALIPPGQPRTRSRACNAGLELARGEFCVVYDAEHRPEPGQLRKAVAAFWSLPPWVVCVQAELRYMNPDMNWLTQCAAAEYAVNFSLFLPGLDRFRLPMPLGGSSNHFRAEALRRLGGWDPHNVTEGADLGVRIARRGWSVRMMASETGEEPDSRLGSWLRQRSRWIKGDCQTWLVHMRSPYRLWRDLGPIRFAGLQLTLALSSFTTLVNPVFWALILAYLVSGPGHIAQVFPLPELYAAAAAMLLGNLLMVYSLMIGCMEHGLFRAVRTMLLVPAYWALMSVAAYQALFQLLNLRRRHYLEPPEPNRVTENCLVSL
jgi:cellulose synthase/poly-beta-1,6-N-acetylglucosamine synthase-like glycosyltransferase